METAHIAAIILLIVMPLWGYRKEKQLLEANASNRKLKIYGQLSSALIVFTVAIIASQGWHAVFYPKMDLGPELGWFWYVMVSLLSFFILSNFVPLLLLGSTTFRASMFEAYRSRSHVYPKTVRERRIYVITAIFVGVGEEVMYRGFLVHYLEQYWWPQSLILCTLCANLLFAVPHYHQGLTGIVNAFIAGMAFSALFMLTGSLAAPIVIHILYDLKLLWISRAYESLTLKTKK